MNVWISQSTEKGTLSTELLRVDLHLVCGAIVAQVVHLQHTFFGLSLTSNCQKCIVYCVNKRSTISRDICELRGDCLSLPL